MGATEALATIEILGADEAHSGLRLSREAGWNQTFADWHLFLSNETVFGIRDDDGVLIATAALVPLPPVTWISMVLVTGAWRRRGLADRLMTHCLAEADRRGLAPWLDATPAGARVYERFGFREMGFGLQRWRLLREGAAPAEATAQKMPIAAFLSADVDAMRFDRSHLLRNLAERSGSVLYDRGGAIALVRDGDRARHIGPMYAPDEDAAGALLASIVAAESGPLLIDVAANRSALLRQVESLGFVFERPFARMAHGAGRIAAPGPTLMAAAGPEFG